MGTNLTGGYMHTHTQNNLISMFQGAPSPVGQEQS